MEDMKKLGWLWLWLPLLGLLAATILFRGVVHAAVDSVRLISVGSLGTDSSDVAPTSVYFFWHDSTGALDSVAGSPVLHGATYDSLEWRVTIDPSVELWSTVMAPAVWAVWNWTAGKDRDNSVLPLAFASSTVQTVVGNVAGGVAGSVGAVLGSVGGNVTGSVGSVVAAVTPTDTVSTGDTIAIMPRQWVAADTAAYQGSATLTAAEIGDTLQARVPGDWAATGAGGTGAFPESLFVYDTANSALVQGATVHIKAADTGSYQNSSGPQATNASGYAIFSIDAGTFPVAVSAQGYFQAGAYQLVTQASPGGRDTVWVYTFSPSVPSGGDSCNVVAFTDAAGSYAKFAPAQTTQDTSGVFLNAKPLRAESDANGIIQQTLPRTAATAKKIKWDVTIYGPRDNVIGEIPAYTVPSQSVDTLNLQ